MKSFWVVGLIVLSLAACGQGELETTASPESTVDISGVNVLWTGTIFDEPAYYEDWTETLACLEISGAPPRITVVSDVFRCGNSRAAYGCSVAGDGVYVVGYWYIATKGGILKEEFVHWVTGIGDLAHTWPLLKKCYNGM